MLLQSSTEHGSNNPSRCWRKTSIRHPPHPWLVIGPCLPSSTWKMAPPRALPAHQAPADPPLLSQVTGAIPQPSVEALQSVRAATPRSHPPLPPLPCLSAQLVARWGPEWGQPPPPSPPLRLRAAMGEATVGRWLSQGTRRATPGKLWLTRSTLSTILSHGNVLVQISTTIGEHRLQVLPLTAHPTLAAKPGIGLGNGGVIHQLGKRSRPSWRLRANGGGRTETQTGGSTGGATGSSSRAM